jgi:hypothetical protein
MNKRRKTMLPLEGIKVVDFTTWIMAPVCGAALGDWGAEVINIEYPESGNDYRWFLMAVGIDEGDVPVSLFGLDKRPRLFWRGASGPLQQGEDGAGAAGRPFPPGCRHMGSRLPYSNGAFNG